MTRAFVILLTVMVIVSCDDDDPEHDPDSIEHFQHHLNANMKYNDLTRAFGEPDDDVGEAVEPGHGAYRESVQRMQLLRNVDLEHGLFTSESVGCSGWPCSRPILASHQEFIQR